MTIQALQDVQDIKGKRVIVRVDFNVPLQDDKVVDDMRIQKSLHTINFLREGGARVILISHIEGKGGVSLAPVAAYLKALFPLTFVKDFLNESTAQLVASMKDGDVVLFENLRVDEGEKNNDDAFARRLAAYADMYVNDAFSVSHRAHASVVALPKLLPHYAGFELLEEIEHLKTVFNPPRPFVFILGGAKFETKIPLIEKFLTLSDYIFVGGALANNFFKEKGLNVGKSLVSDGYFNLKEHFGDQRLVLPLDLIVKNNGVVSTKKPEEISGDDVIVDVGPASVLKIKELVADAKFVLWNGPMGNYEEGFKDQTIGIAKVIVESGVHAALGGGDTTAAVAAQGLEKNKNIFVSTGGGAMLQYLLDETLPGIDALK
ncbi:MAG: hypothetical protein RL094_172 [Candidatus Parcubacteria bacterium]|jgi:phosphoglycerate kinase